MEDWSTGFIDKTGKFVIAPDFYVAGSFHDGLAKARVKYGDRNEGYINKTGKFVIEPRFGGVDGRFSEGLAGVQVKGKVGFINKTGRIVIKPVFEAVYEFHEGLAACVTRTNEGRKIGFIDKTGRFVIKPKSEYGTIGGFHKGLATICVEDKYGFIDKTGKIVVKPLYNYVEGFSEGLACVTTIKN